MTTAQLTCRDGGTDFAEIVANAKFCGDMALNYEFMWVSRDREEFMRLYGNDLHTAMEKFLNKPSAISEIAGAIISWVEKINQRNEQGHESVTPLYKILLEYGGKIPRDPTEQNIVARRLSKLAARLMSLWLESPEEIHRKRSERLLAETQAKLAETQAKLTQALAKLNQIKATLA